MGVTISSKNYSIDLGYAGFFRLRRKVAELLGEDAGKHYAELGKSHCWDTEEEADKFWDEYDREVDRLASAYPKNVRKVFDFLYQSDCEGEVTYGTCKQILAVIGDYDDNILYGYAGRPDCAKFKDFKRILEDCVATKRKMEWF